MLHDEQELLDYLTENYSDRKSPAKKEWTFQVIFSYLSSTVSIGFSLGLMKNEYYLLRFNPVYELPEAKPCVLS